MLTRGRMIGLGAALALGLGVYLIAQTEDETSGKTTGDAIQQCLDETTLTEDQCARIVMGNR